MATNEWVTVRLRLQGARQMAREAAQAAGAIVGVGDATRAAGVQAELSRVEMFAWRQGLYTLRRYLFYSTAAVTGFAGAMAKLGLTFDTAREEGTAAFTGILGSASAAGTEVSRLTELTFETGLQLTTLTQAATEMQGFGFTLRSINVDMRALADYAERAHLGVSGFESLVGVFDQIQSAGKLTSVSLRTLTHLGVPALQILRRELHLTAQQMTALQRGQLVIPAQFALPALATGLQARANQLGPSLTQEVGRTHALVAAIFGRAEAGPFSFITRELDHFNSALERSAHGGSFLTALDPSGRLLRDWRTLVLVFHDVEFALGAMWTLVRPFLPLLSLFGSLVGWTARQTTVMRIALTGLAFWYAVTRTRLALLWAETRLVSGAETIYLSLLYALDAATAAWATATALATGEMTLLDVAMDANPIVLFALAIAGLGLGLYELARHFKTVAHWAREAWTWLSKPIPGTAWLDHLGGGHFSWHDWIRGRGPAFPGLASGGTVTSGGSVMVGERGPELLHLPRGASVQPLQARPDLLSKLQIVIYPSDVNLDGRKIAENTFRWQAALGART